MTHKSTARLRSTIAFGAVAVAALWMMACDGMGRPAGPVVHEHHAVERGTATQARIEIDMSAGDLTMKSGAAMLFEGDFDFNVPSLKPAIAYGVDGSTGSLKVSQGSASGNHENGWRLSLDETTPIDLDVKLSAGDATIHLPASVGISVQTSGLIGDTNVSGLEKREGRWINARAEASPVTIDLTVQHAMGDLRLLAE